ncbi:MAG TPA: chorismate lyase [Thiotrichaceae bacterium]|nr:chorismate lyase [Thiotrichaceae bacterium]HIM08643.1 chorismate lyase [Gammaproteobacteria bacterium]
MDKKLKLNWQKKEIVSLDITDQRISDFLFQEGSLTRFIQERCDGNFSIELLTESWCSPISDEIEFLSLPSDEITFLRESRLKCDTQTLVYARTVIPGKTLSGKNKKLTELGTTPLGDILFNDEMTYRTDMRYTKITIDCELHSKATKDSNITSELWGRQSLFYSDHQPLLVTEIFLPAILECNKN